MERQTEKNDREQNKHLGKMNVTRAVKIIHL